MTMRIGETVPMVRNVWDVRNDFVVYIALAEAVKRVRQLLKSSEQIKYGTDEITVYNDSVGVSTFSESCISHGSGKHALLCVTILSATLNRKPCIYNKVLKDMAIKEWPGFCTFSAWEWWPCSHHFCQSIKQRVLNVGNCSPTGRLEMFVHYVLN